MEDRKGFFGPLLTHAYIAGTLVPDKLLHFSPAWQLKFFRIYQIIPFLFWLTMLFAQLAAMYRYWGDIQIILDIIGSTAVNVISIWGTLFCILYGERIHRIVKRMETNSVLAMPMTQIQPQLKEVLDRMQRKLRWLSLGVRISITFSVLFWIVSPFIIRVLLGEPAMCHGYQNKTMTPQELLQEDGYNQFFIIMWLPLDAQKWYSYLLLYQIICYIFFLKILITYTIIIIYFFVLTATEFELIGILVHLVDADEEEKPEMSITPAGLESFLSKQSNDPPDEKCATMYLIEIIKLHQNALESAADVNVTIDVCFRGGLGSLVVMIITSMYQITVIPSLAPKFLCVIIACLFHMFIFAFFGDTILDQCEKVGELAYSTKWYERPKEFKQLIYMIQMRTSSPTMFYIFRVIRMTLASFSDIMSICYRVFMLMLEIETAREIAICLEEGPKIF